MPKLKHVAEIVGRGEAELAVVIERHRIIGYWALQRPAEGLRHLRARQVFSSDADRFADMAIACLEDPVRTATNVLGCDAGHLPVAQGQREDELAIGAFARAHPE